MVTQRDESNTPDELSRRESGLPGGGRGRIDVVERTGVYPGSGPYPDGPAEIRTPASFVRGQWDDEGRQVEGGSALTYLGGEILLGGPTPPSSSPPVGPASPSGGTGGLQPFVVRGMAREDVTPQGLVPIPGRPGSA